MQFQRQMMRMRVARRFARVPGQHGDGYTPAFYPMPIGANIYGAPWAKPKNGNRQALIVAFIIMPFFVYNYLTGYAFHVTRVVTPPRRPWFLQRYLYFTDMDDPDYKIKLQHMKEEVGAWGAQDKDWARQLLRLLLVETR